MYGFARQRSFQKIAATAGNKQRTAAVQKQNDVVANADALSGTNVQDDIIKHYSGLDLTIVMPCVVHKRIHSKAWHHEYDLRIKRGADDESAKLYASAFGNAVAAARANKFNLTLEQLKAPKTTKTKKRDE